MPHVFVEDVAERDRLKPKAYVNLSRDWALRSLRTKLSDTKAINEIRMGGVNVLPLVEGGKGIGVSTGVSSGHWAAAGGAGTFSAVNADYYDEDGNPLDQNLSRPHPARAP